MTPWPRIKSHNQYLEKAKLMQYKSIFFTPIITYTFFSAQINYQDRLGLTPLFYAVEMHSIPMTTLLLSHHANVNAREQRRHSSPLHFVAGTSRYNIFAEANDTAALARLLINAGAEVNAEDNEGSTTLHVAVDTKDERLVEALLDAGANVDKKDEYGNTPLHVLLMTAQIKTSLESIRLEGIARMLLDKGEMEGDIS